MRTGKVINCKYGDYNYEIQTDRGPKTLYRFDVVIQLPSGELIQGKYDAQDLNKPSFVIGETIDFDTEEKTTKRGDKYLKLKKAQKEKGFNNDNPEVRAQIERNVALHCACELHKSEIGKDQALRDITTQMYAWIRNKAEIDGGSRQSSITAQGAAKLVCEYVKILDIKNMDHFWNHLENIYNYISNG